jgi:flagellar hook protein FlgE
MLRSLYSGISGMKANQVKLDVIGNNIANVGTTAFKGSRVRFQDMVSQSIVQAIAPGAKQGGVNSKQIGLGVQVSGIDTLVNQGAMQPTSRNLDVAMDGEGYLMLLKGLVPKGPGEEDASDDDGTYSDTQGVTLNNDYTLKSANGSYLNYTRDGALTLDNEGNLLNSEGLRVLGYALTAETTDPENADAEGVKTTSLVYDENRKPIMDYTAADSQKITTDKKLIPLVIPDRITIPANPEAEENAKDSVEQVLIIRTFSIGKDGIIKAVLEDGKVALLGQIAVASFKNPAGLLKTGGNTYQSTSNSGLAVMRTGEGATVPAAEGEEGDENGGVPFDNSKAYGDMLQGVLEMSNVDLSEQFTDMIITTRAFQAAGKTISTGDEILQEIINLKR